MAIKQTEARKRIAEIRKVLSNLSKKWGEADTVSRSRQLQAVAELVALLHKDEINPPHSYEEGEQA